jgi:hypothetical protein
MARPFIPALHTIKMAIVHSLAGQNVVNVLHIRDTLGAPDRTRATTLADALATSWVTNIMASLSNDLRLSHIDWTILDSQTSPAGRTGEAGVSGSINSPSEASNVALVYTLRTALRGRSYRGRLYIGGIPQSQRADAVTASIGWADGLAAGFSLLISDMFDVDAEPVVVSYQHNKVITNPAHVETVDHFTTDYYFDSQRRRLHGRGR